MNTYVYAIEDNVENISEVTESVRLRPGTAPYPPLWKVGLEGDDNAVHGNVTENDVEDDRGNDHQQ